MEEKKESLFKSIIRSFLKAFFSTSGVLAALFILAIFFGIAISSSTLSVDQVSMSVAPDANGNRKVLSDKTPVILRVKVTGVIGTPRHTAEDLQRQLDESQGGALTEGRVKALFIEINSPGGLATDSDTIYRSLAAYKEKYKIPVYAFINGMCASGAMYAACAADKVFATPVSIIGSVGVLLGPNFNVVDLMDKIGVKELTLTEGKDKDTLSPFRPWKEGEADSIRAITQYYYETFVAVVTQNRPKISKDALINTYGARVFAAPTALKYGFIDDDNSSYSTAMAALVKEANIEGDYQVVDIKPEASLLKEFIKEKSPLVTGTLKHQFFESTESYQEPFLFLHKL